MKKILLFILSVLFSINVYTQSCTSTVYYDNMENWTWAGDWYLYSFSNFYTNFSVSPTASAVHYGSGTSSSGIEQDWYVLPTINGLNPNYTYQVRFKLGSYVATSPSATTRGLDTDDFLQVQLSRNGSVYVAEMTIRGFSNQTWNYSATGVAAKTANGTNTIYQRTIGGARPDGYSTIELTLQPNTTSVAIDIYTRCNSAGEEFWIDNVELIEIIPTPTLTITGDNSVCNGTSTTLTANGGDTYVWSGGISNGVSFTPATTTSYSVTGTNTGMLNGLGTRNTCNSTTSISVQVKPVPNLPILNPDTTICPDDFAVLYGTSNIGTLQWYDALTNGTLLGTGSNFTTQLLLNNTSFYAQSELNGCTSLRATTNVIVNQNCILPIYLSSFTGENEGRLNNLYWITQQEINSSHFEIEKSKDGFNFNKIDVINATNSNPYHFIDENSFVGNNYYRLKMVDLDGTYSYSPIIVLFSDYSIDYKVYPNPFDDTLVYTYYAETPENLEIYIFNILGQLIHFEKITCESCINTTNINVKDFLPGTYRLVVKHKETGHETNQTIIKK